MPGFAGFPWLCQRAILSLCFAKLSCLQGELSHKTPECGRCVLAASWGQGCGEVNVHSFGEQEFAPAGFVHRESRAEKFAKVNGEGKQLAAGGGERYLRGCWKGPCFLWEAHSRKASLALLHSCWP